VDVSCAIQKYSSNPSAAILQIIKQPSLTLNMLAALLPIYKLQSTPLTNPLLHITTDSIFLQSFKLTE
jgi:hypothetical protein